MSGDGIALKVLVVEDSKVTLKVLCGYLERMGVRQILTAETGAAAITSFERERPDIILLDAQLPDLDGFDVAQHIRAKEHKQDWAAIIFLTSMSKDENLARGIAAGGDDYLMKPISEVVLQAKVRAMQRLVEMQRELVEMTHQLNDANAELRRLSTTDELTGIANRRMYEVMAKREWKRCQRMHKPLSLVMVDVDYFKQFNDKYGHQAGDECLKVVAEQVSKIAPRPTDLAARYGGEEFVLVLGETDTDGAKWVADRLCQQITELQVPHYASPSRHLTVSCGVAAVLPDKQHDLETLLKSADHALYQAKAGGRNQVKVGAYGAL